MTKTHVMLPTVGRTDCADAAPAERPSLRSTRPASCGRFALADGGSFGDGYLRKAHRRARSNKWPVQDHGWTPEPASAESAACSQRQSARTDGPSSRYQSAHDELLQAQQIVAQRDRSDQIADSSDPRCRPDESSNRLDQANDVARVAGSRGSLSGKHQQRSRRRGTAALEYTTALSDRTSGSPVRQHDQGRSAKWDDCSASERTGRTDASPGNGFSPTHFQDTQSGGWSVTR